LFINREKFEKELNEKEKELNELTKNLSEKDKQTEEYKREIENFIDKKFELNNEVSICDANIENINKREKILKNDIQINISELDKLRIEKEEISKRFNDIESERKKIVKNIEEISEIKNISNNKNKEYEQQLNINQSEYRIKESRLKFLKETEREKEGFNKSIKALLLECEKNNELSKYVEGTVSSLIEVEKKYQLAIEMALGASLQNIVTPDENSAKKLVDYLRKNNIGRASFLPITTVKGKKIEKYTSKNIDGIYGIASDLIKYEKKYQGIIYNLLGRTVIVENMDVAINLAKQNNYLFKIVTLNGDIINPSGMISGGATPNKTVSILGRNGEIKELERTISQIDEKIKKIEKEKNEYEVSINDIIQKSKTLEKELQENNIIYATEKQKLLAIDENIKKLETRLEKNKNEQKELKIQNENENSTKQQLEKNIKEIEEKKEKLNKIVNEHTDMNKENQKYIDDLNFDVTNLKISVNSFNESENSIQEIVERINNEILNNDDEIKIKENNMNKIIEENKKLSENITKLNEKIVKIEEKLKNKNLKIQELKEDRNNKNDELKSSENKIIEQFSIIENIKSELTKIEIRKEKIENDIEEIINKLWEEYELTPNNISKDYPKPENVAKSTREVNKIRNEIKELGSINIDSIEEYKETSKRYDFMSEQRYDIENSMMQLKKIIEEMTETMKVQFTKQFKIINENFQKTFKELFGGGNAELKLEDENNVLETGIEIKVQPPGKKLQNMTLLSGGEKAFTAIALLFAMLKINPSPFCILDEIEAALDDVNVYRFAEYLKNFVGETQFLTITHRKGTMEQASSVYGVTMEESGISKLLSMKLK
jgi:chromosome segregation protein